MGLRPNSIFLDANVLYSAAYEENAKMKQFWGLTNVQLVTSSYALNEAARNLKSAAQEQRLAALLEQVTIVPESAAEAIPPEVVLHPKDRPILAAAIAAGCAYLATGDINHFGKFYGHSISGTRVEPPAVLLKRFKR